MTKIMIFRAAVRGELVCIETVEDRRDRAEQWALDALQDYARGRTPTPWQRVGSFLCSSAGDYFAVCHQHEEKEI